MTLGPIPRHTDISRWTGCDFSVVNSDFWMQSRNIKFNKGNINTCTEITF